MPHRIGFVKGKVVNAGPDGDFRRGHIGIWRFTGDERIEEVRAVAFGK